jgi:hypothetical protein
MLRTLLIAVVTAVAVALGAGVAQARTSLVEVDARPTGTYGGRTIRRLRQPPARSRRVRD